MKRALDRGEDEPDPAMTRVRFADGNGPPQPATAAADDPTDGSGRGGTAKRGRAAESRLGGGFYESDDDAPDPLAAPLDPGFGAPNPVGEGVLARAAEDRLEQVLVSQRAKFSRGGAGVGKGKREGKGKGKERADDAFPGGDDDDMFAGSDDDDDADGRGNGGGSGVDGDGAFEGAAGSGARLPGGRSRFDQDPDEVLEPMHFKEEARAGIVTRNGDYIPRERGAAEHIPGEDDEPDAWADALQVVGETTDAGGGGGRGGGGGGGGGGARLNNNGGRAVLAGERRGFDEAGEGLTLADADMETCVVQLVELLDGGDGDTVGAALARCRGPKGGPLGRKQRAAKGGKRRKTGKGDDGCADAMEEKEAEDPAAAAARAERVERITMLADKLMGGGYTDVYGDSRTKILARVCPAPDRVHRFTYADDPGADVQGPAPFTDILSWVWQGYISDERPIWIIGPGGKRHRLNIQAVLAQGSLMGAS